LERKDLRKSQQTSGFPGNPKVLNEARRLRREIEETKKKGYATIHLQEAKRKEAEKDTGEGRTQKN
jgi:hypothetical protein